MSLYLRVFPSRGSLRRAIEVTDKFLNFKTVPFYFYFFPGWAPNPATHSDRLNVLAPRTTTCSVNSTLRNSLKSRSPYLRYQCQRHYQRVFPRQDHITIHYQQQQGPSLEGGSEEVGEGFRWSWNVALVLCFGTTSKDLNNRVTTEAVYLL